MAAKTIIQVRRDTETNWSSVNPVLAVGEHGYVTSGTNAGMFKIGDGVTAWNSLAFQNLVGPTGPAGPVAGSANQIIYKDGSNVATGSSGLQYDGTSIKVNGNLESVYQNGDEGGEIFLNKPVTNTTLANGVTIDVFRDKLRFFENGGTNRGFYIDMTTGGAGVATNLVSGGAYTLPTASSTVLGGIKVGSTLSIDGSGVLSLSTTSVTAASYGSSTAIPTFTVDANGRLTAASTVAVVAPAGTLSGTTLNGTVVNSSLTSVAAMSAGPGVVWVDSSGGLTSKGSALPLAMSSGHLSITPSAANTPTSATVTFPSSRFTQAPIVTISANTTLPGTVVTGTGTSSISSTGFTAWVTRTNTSATQLNWMAIQQTSSAYVSGTAQ